ncbi:MAG: endonuclease MutS2 [Clostridiales bacterium]
MEERNLRVLEYYKIIDKLMSYNSTLLGKELTRNLLPEKDLKKIESIQKETKDAVEFILKKGTPPLGGINDIKPHLNRVELNAILMPKELLQISGVLRACRVLVKYLKNSRVLNEENSLYYLIETLETNKRLETDIDNAIESEEEISDGASTTLLNIRRQIRNIQDSIKGKLNSVIRSTKYQKFMQDSLVTIRGDRYVVPVKQEYRSEIPGLIHDSSSSGQTIFIEPMAVVEANNDIKGLKIKEQEEIERILISLTNGVMEFLEELKSNISILTQIDFIVGKAKFSLATNSMSPKLNNSGIIKIKKGRHPLIEKDDVVPIDFWIGEDFSSLIITGPNTGGKTVTLKTIGLFTMMVQAGLHIPANDGTEISIFNDIFADIGDEQSIEQSLSTFSSHMKNIVGILEKANKESLILFDELGAGTDPTEGAALAIGILEYLSENSIRTIATTHYSELKVYALSKNYVENACCEFDIKTLRPTYKLLIGVPGKSNAFAISQKLGLSDYVLEKSKDFLTKDNIKFEDALLNIEENRSKAESEKIEAEINRIKIEKLRKDLENQKEKYNKKKDDIVKEAKIEAKKIIEDAKKNTENIIEDLYKLKREKDELNSLKEVEKVRIGFKKQIDEFDYDINKNQFSKKTKRKSVDKLIVGDNVYITNLDQKGVVITLPNKNGDVGVQVGIMKVNIHISNLELREKEKIKQYEKIHSYYKKSKESNAKSEIDLRGQALDEAIENVDKYLDDVSIAGLHEVTLIHGKGTGVLRAGIQDYLKSHPHVKSFRRGKFGEGEAGVTVVEIK